jgi:hypothetical protein
MLERGTTIAGYRIDSVLGQGGMGTVYEATQLSLDRVVALKLLASHLSDDVGFRERFRREGQVQARLEHPHIVTVYEAGETEYGLFIAMRLVRGRTLKNLITAHELDVNRTLKILEPVAEALDEAHEIGLIHRDIKPQNVLVGGRDHSFLADFGLTKGTTETSLTKTGHFVGTFDYIPPEQINGQRATSASDIYSLAGVLYECLTGEVPYPKPVEAAVLYAHVSDPPPRPSVQRPDLPPQLDDVVGRAMAKDPSQRHPTATELIQDVRRSFTQERPRVEPSAFGITSASASPRPAAPPPADLTAPGPTAPAVRGRAAAEPQAPPAAPRAAPAARAAAGGAPAAHLPGAPAARPAAAPARRPPPAKGRSASVPLLAAGGLVVVVVAGFLIGKGTSGGDPTPKRGEAVSAGDLSVRAPASWERADEPVKIRGLQLKDPVSLQPGGTGSGGSITVGKSKATGSALLPGSLLKSLDARPASPEAVGLGDLEALRYAELEPKRPAAGTLRVYAAPIRGGVATVACSVPPEAAGATTSACDKTAASLRLKSGESFPLGPDEQYDRNLDAAIKRLNTETKKAAATLRGADTAAGQAKAATSLQGDYRRAADSLRGVTRNPQVTGVNARIVAALQNLARGYGQLATAARADDADAYKRAGAAIARAKDRLRRALRAV